uniref:F-box domain-containing protein n=1 Tax=Steinernema glaseri TaxID=37863 RepID=A0A1I7YUW6_9BILA
MDHLSYDLVEEIASYLPRSELETIARVAARSADLENWSIASEDQLERRFPLVVFVHVQGFEHEQKKTEKAPRIRLSVEKVLSDGSREEWDFKNWRYAWIQRASIHASLHDDASVMCPRTVLKESDMHQVLRLVSLPVDSSTKTFLSIRYHYNSGIPPEDLVDLFWKVAQKTQKDFAYVTVGNTDEFRLRVFDGFIADSIKRGSFLEDLFYWSRSIPQRDLCEAIASIIGKRRGRPLTAYFQEISIEPDGLELIVDAWLQSDGTFEEKVVESENYNNHSEAVWAMIKEKYKAVVQWQDLGLYAYPMESPTGFVAHPKKLSSLFISPTEIRVVKFEPWHVPVDFQSIDSLVGKWREGCGFYVWRRKWKLYFQFNTDDDWFKLVEKYGPAVDEGSRLQIAHPICPTVLEVEKCDDWFEIGVKHELFTEEKLESFVAEWKEGNGKTLVNGLTRMEVEVKESLFLSLPQSHSHPLGNVRCLLSEEGGLDKFASYVMRISIVPIDPEDVED